MDKPLRYTAHARTVLAERELSEAWIEQTVRSPEWQTPDPRPGVVRRYRTIPERDGRILRAAIVETESEIRILSAFLDRRARKPE